MIKIQQNIELKELTTFKIGGPADFFVIARQPDELLEALHWAKERNLKTFTLGGGSNLLFPDEGFRGLVIKTDLTDLKIDGQLARVGAGCQVADLIEQTLGQNLVGLEFLAGIPGTVGGAVRGNAGTYGIDIASVIRKIFFIDDQLQTREVVPQLAGFKYRHSFFKDNNYYITEVLLELNNGDVTKSRQLIEERLALRHKGHPSEPSAGCIFKNILFENVNLDKLKALELDLTPFENYKKIPAGFLIDKLGLKGKQIGGAQVSPKHGNYIINTGQATAKDVITLISLIKQQVRDAYGIQLEEEAQLVYNS